MSDRASGVRNLRAMFEQSKSSATPEPRGRSPADTVATPDGPVRPTSKVRASFVSVEPGKLIPADPGIAAGTTDAASSSTATHRRESFSVSEDIRDDVTAALKKEVSESQEAPKDSEAIPGVLSDVVPEQAVETRESSRDPPPMHEDKAEGTMPNLGSIMKGSDFPGLAPAIEKPEVEPAVEPEAVPEEALVAEEPEEVQEDVHEEEQEEISELEPEEISELPEEISELDPEEVPVVVHDEPLKEEPEIETKEETEEALKDEAKEEPKEVDEKPTTAAPLNASSDNPDKIVTGAQEEAFLKPADPKDEAAVPSGKALSPTTEDLRAAELPPAVTELSPAAAEPSVATPKAAGTPLKSKVNGTSVANGKMPTKKPPKISTTKAAGTAAYSSMSPLMKSPGFARLPKTPTTPRAVSLASKARSPAPLSRSPAPAPAPKSPAPTKELPKPAAPKTAATKPVAPKTVAPKAATTIPKPAALKATPALKEPIRAPVAKTSRSSLRPAATTAPPKPKAPLAETKKPIPRPLASAHPPNPVHKESTATASTGGFKKPKPKSPTRPVRLPSHLTAPTTASAAKHGDEAAAPKLVRKPSTTRPAPKTAIPARKISSRASLAPSTAPAKRPESRTSTKGGAEDGFLARMMRPTNASASKTHEKPASPPRRGGSVRIATKPKGHESVVAMGKRKVGEVATKAKDAVTNGHSSAQHSDDHHAEDHHNEDHHSEDHHNEDQHIEVGAAEPTTSKQEAPDREATPEQGVESSAIELQTPNFEGQAIR